MVKTIAVTGCIGHIGTTTQALQAVKTLSRIGYSVCYKEMNKTNYLYNLSKLYSNAKDAKEFIEYENIIMFKRNSFRFSKESNFDYIVKDYGAADLESFEETSLSEQYTKVVVCGSKPNEIFKTQDLLLNPIYDDAFFIFSFVPESEQASIVSLMGSRADKTLFTGIIEDPFVYSPESANLFQRILNYKKE